MPDFRTRHSRRQFLDLAVRGAAGASALSALGSLAWAQSQPAAAPNVAFIAIDDLNDGEAASQNRRAGSATNQKGDEDTEEGRSRAFDMERTP